MAVRAGAGIFHGVTGITCSGWYLGARPPLVKSATITNGVAHNPGSGIPVTAQFPISPGTLPEECEIPTVYIYSFGIQHRLPFQTVLDVSYVGNSGRHLSFSRPFNFVTPEVFAANLGKDLRPFLPCRGLAAFNIVEPSVTSSYSSLQVAARKRSGQFTFGLAYTLGKIIGFGNEGVAGGAQGPFNIRAERSELEESRRHHIVITHTWELPWFRPQTGLLGRILGGWSISAVWAANTGRPFAPGLTSAPRQVATRPDVVGDWRLPEEERTLFRWFRTEAFRRPADFTYGNSGKWVIRGPGTIDLGAFALKNVRIRESLQAQLRIEAFNAMNHMNLESVNTTLGQSAFGQINSVGSQRYLQLGVKLNW